MFTFQGRLLATSILGLFGFSDVGVLFTIPNLSLTAELVLVLKHFVKYY